MSDYLAANRATWDGWSDKYVARAWERWKEAAVTWGIWRIPESELGILGDVAGKDVLEYGCGAAQCGCRLAVGGARVVGVDLSPRQLGDAETPFADASFDLVFCDHGAMTSGTT